MKLWDFFLILTYLGSQRLRGLFSLFSLLWLVTLAWLMLSSIAGSFWRLLNQHKATEQKGRASAANVGIVYPFIWAIYKTEKYQKMSQKVC